MMSEKVFKRVVIALLVMTGLVFSGARDGYTADAVIKIGCGMPHYWYRCLRRPNDT